MGLEIGIWFILPISHDGHFGVGVVVDVDVVALDDAFDVVVVITVIDNSYYLLIIANLPKPYLAH